MPPAFVLSQDQTLRLTRTINQPGSKPGQQTIQANEDPHQTRFRQANDNPGRTPQASTQKRRSRCHRKPNQEHVRRGKRLSPNAAAHASLLTDQQCQKTTRRSPRPIWARYPSRPCRGAGLYARRPRPVNSINDAFSTLHKAAKHQGFSTAQRFARQRSAAKRLSPGPGSLKVDSPEGGRHVR